MIVQKVEILKKLEKSVSVHDICDCPEVGSSIIYDKEEV